MQPDENSIPLGASLDSPLPDSAFYDRVGREPFFVNLIERFYALVEEDPVLRPLYPSNLEPGKAHLAAFLAQYWGGPPGYTEERGHPRLRMRHLPFAIGPVERDAWVGHMTASVEAAEVETEDAAALIAYFQRAATFLINQTENP